jgi:transposase-like protein
VTKDALPLEPVPELIFGLVGPIGVDLDTVTGLLEEALNKAVECLIKDREPLLAFYDFPAEHWKHLRTSNVIESAFATIRHRTVRSKGSLSNKTALAMIFKLAQAAEKTWRRLDGHTSCRKSFLV